MKDLFRNKVINAKSTSRRPLSSWKQSISACGPGPAPWVDKSTLYSLGIEGMAFLLLVFYLKIDVDSQEEDEDDENSI